MLLQHDIDLLESKLCMLFRASLMLGYIPHGGWVRKLTMPSFLLKMLEKLVDSHIRERADEQTAARTPICISIW